MVTALPLLFAGRRTARSGPRQSRRDDPGIGGTRDPATRLENRIGEPAAIRFSTWPRKFFPAGLASIAGWIRDLPRDTARMKLNAPLFAEDVGVEACVRAEPDPFFRKALGAEFGRLLRSHQKTPNRAVSGGVSEWKQGAPPPAGTYFGCYLEPNDAY